MVRVPVHIVTNIVSDVYHKPDTLHQNDIHVLAANGVTSFLVRQDVAQAHVVVVAGDKEQRVRLVRGTVGVVGKLRQQVLAEKVEPRVGGVRSGGCWQPMKHLADLGDNP